MMNDCLGSGEDSGLSVWMDHEIVGLGERSGFRRELCTPSGAKRV